ncbi:MAG: hypothetical protein KAI97_06395, partial [Gemmatimonadetes bacterium]|nr:hypothetical protein [Gemmatimonadota bacterium]
MTLTLHLIAGLGALGLGTGILLREPARVRNWSFALLCGALALWNLGYVGMAYSSRPAAWRSLFLIGSCASAPLGLHVALVLTGAGRRLRRGLLVPAWLLSGVLWLLSWLRLGDLWYLLAIAVIGGILVIALGVLGRHIAALPPGPEKRALQLVLWGAIVAVVGGLSDLLP